ncbi:MAG TPA: site-2 protease family protein [Nitrososphaerales archaeon]|nr:site-2 protease family protein [Nitrososphaerales archaeon]
MEEEVKRVQFAYGLVFLRTKRFQSLMDRLGKRRVSRPISWALLYIMPVAAAIGLYIFLSEAAILFSPLSSEVGTAIRGVSPLAYLGLPGINPYIPWVDGWIALIVAMIVHEGAHGVVARSLGLPVKASGLLFFLIVPIGAFVEVDEEAVKVARARDSARVWAAGAGVNFVIGIIALLLLFAVVSTMTPLTSGLAVSQVNVPSPAAKAGIMPGDFVKAINGVSYNDTGQLSAAEAAGKLVPNQTVTITVWSAGVTRVANNVTLVGNPGNSSRAFIGITSAGSDYLQTLVQFYTGSFFSRPALYLCIPTFPQCQDAVPFSGSNSAFYTSTYGASLVPLATLLYWLFFLNFNLAIFNSLPLGPLDGGQAFRLGVKALGRGKLSEGTLTRISALVAVAVVVVIAAVPLAAYLHLI